MFKVIGHVANIRGSSFVTAISNYKTSSMYFIIQKLDIKYTFLLICVFIIVLIYFTVMNHLIMYSLCEQ